MTPADFISVTFLIPSFPPSRLTEYPIRLIDNRSRPSKTIHCTHTKFGTFVRDRTARIQSKFQVADAYRSTSVTARNRCYILYVFKPFNRVSDLPAISTCLYDTTPIRRLVRSDLPQRVARPENWLGQIRPTVEGCAMRRLVRSDSTHRRGFRDTKAG